MVQSLVKFTPIGSHVDENEKKKKKKIVKIPKFKYLVKGKNSLETWWIATFPQNLALIRLMISENRDGRTDGLHSISSADTVKQN